MQCTVTVHGGDYSFIDDVLRSPLKLGQEVHTKARKNGYVLRDVERFW
jgi:hypothetical protein